MRPVRVVIAETDGPTRAGVRLALERAGFAIEAEASDAAEAAEAVARLRPDVCLLGVALPGDGIALAAEICARRHSPAVVMLTDAMDREELLQAIRAGAVGYLRKDMDPGRLPFVIEGVLRGEAAIPRTLVSGLLEEFRARATRRASPILRDRGVDLTNREWEVLELLEKGATTAEIAAALHVSPVTVRRHIAVALGKLGVEDRADAVQLMRELQPV